MHVETINRSGYTETEQDVIRVTGAWYLVQELQARTHEDGPVYHASTVRDVDEGERVAVGFTEMFPRKLVAVVGIGRGQGDNWPLIYAYLPDGSDFPGVQDRDLQALVSEADRVHRKSVNVATRARNAVTGQGQPAEQPGAMGGPDLTDHLYQNKQAFGTKKYHDIGTFSTLHPDRPARVAETIDQAEPPELPPAGGEGGGQ